MIKLKNGCICVDGVFKTCESAPFSLPPEQEYRLVRLGVAEFVESAPEQEVQEAEQIEAVPMESMTMAELKQIAVSCGISPGKYKKRADLIAALLAEPESETEDDAPLLSAEDPV